ncbi:MAG: hypothetical protein DCC71_16500 [Proteobacteria bacterium]|nr:MAG: hypothetical protein DCC71_16500 [Pseudomonadota bacterium]
MASCRSDRAQAPRPEAKPVRELIVTAHAYNSVPEQTDARPRETASGEILRPGMRAIAVSADLLAMGLDYGSRVSIESLEGEYVVLDRMGDGHRRSIDVYMGDDRAAAERFGKRKLRLRWLPDRTAKSEER